MTSRILVVEDDRALRGVLVSALQSGGYEVEFAADGSAAYTGDCAQGSDVARWQAKFNGVELKTARGETVAILKGKDGIYTGTRFSDGSALKLSADGAAVASTH